MAERKKYTYKELCGFLGEAILESESIKCYAKYLEREKKALKRDAKRARWFSEERYEKFSLYWQCRAELAANKDKLRRCMKRIQKLERAVADCFYGTPEGRKFISDFYPTDGSAANNQATHSNSDNAS